MEHLDEVLDRLEEESINNIVVDYEEVTHYHKE